MLRNISIRLPQQSDAVLIKGLVCQYALQNISNKTNQTFPTIKKVDDCWEKIIQQPALNPIFVAEDNGRFAGAALCTMQNVLHIGGPVCQVNDLVISKFANQNDVRKELLAYVDNYSKHNGAIMINSVPIYDKCPSKITQSKSNSVKISKCTIDNISSIKYISELTFRETFAEGNTEEDMKQYSLQHFNYNTIKNEIETPGSHFFLAELNGVIAGYMKINFNSAQTEKGYDNSLEIQRIYIAKKFKNNHIGSLLIDKAIDIGQKSNLDYIWLGVWEYNYSAQQFYVAKGFYKCSEHIFVLGTDKQTDYIMKLPLK